jgi:hypothetical protein
MNVMQQILVDRQIEWLFHFTRAENLPNILKYGLLPRSALERRNIDFAFNDNYRYDNCRDAICISIEFPNYKMFYPLRMGNPHVDWAVLLLDAQVICDFECAFCATNAGSALMYQIDIEKRKGKKAFLKLFDELPNCPTRKEMKLGDWYPTDPQSEVLVFGNIPTIYIKKVLFKNQRVLNSYIDLFPSSILGQVNTKAFSYRSDWEYWR